ncbi:glycosyltransferase family 4 protein [Pseudanabaena sp. FACHB-2040]|uniref:glycosyltransferase family 4 protein n=1 Tax=Pseudanabaena sp. FACHB-2040 TaxID=2692859 RepID=UPI001688A8DB|nr:glycosyltransferase family 4 protein [Pseudanabaena sp. FACHB-2040]MBD2260575.1 glycosyltransferase family 4 protein [Pseudanabaena sp. FACHB-2040]
MNILLALHYDLGPNAGAAGSTYNLGHYYRKLGHQVYFYSTSDQPRRMISGKLRRATFSIFLARHISSLLAKVPIDVIDASTGDAWIWGQFLRKQNSQHPLLVTRSHGLEHLEHMARLDEVKKGNLKLSWKYPLYYGGFKLWEEAASFRCADLAFALNQEEANYITNGFGLDRAQVYVFPNGIPESFLNRPFSPLPTEESVPIRIAQIGTYIARKGIQYAKPAINHILKRHPNVEFTFLGTQCPECPTAEQVYQDFEPDLHERIRVIPRYDHDQLPELLEGHHIKLFPTISEGFGKALIEAMACGLAPVTSAASGPLEIVKDGHDGLVVPIADSQAIEQALEKLICDRTFLEQLRKNAYLSAQEYSWEKIARRRTEAYEKALATTTAGS